MQYVKTKLHLLKCVFYSSVYLLQGICTPVFGLKKNYVHNSIMHLTAKALDRSSLLSASGLRQYKVLCLHTPTLQTANSQLK